MKPTFNYNRTGIRQTSIKQSNLTSSLAIAAIIVGLTGCNQTDEEINIDYSHLQKSSMKDSYLISPTRNNFSNLIKNGLRLRLSEGVQILELASATSGPTSGDSSATTTSFSTTNVHEIGVDEADRLKFDGQYLYQVNHIGYQSMLDSSGSNTVIYNNGIRILKTNDNDASVELVSEIKNDSDDLQILDVFLRAESNQLVSVKNTQYYTWNSLLIDSDWQWSSGKTEIQLFNVQVPETPTEQWKIEIEGNLEGSRRVDNMLYLVTRYIPNIAEINQAATTDEEKKANEVLIAQTPLSDLLPHYQTNDGAIRSLVQEDDCFVADGTANNEGYADIITLVAIDLDSQQVTSSACLNSNVQGIYSSTNGFYIGGSEYSNWQGFNSFTAIHKFDLQDDQIDYKASASLSGHLGWSDPAFRMSEYNNDLRIITTHFDNASGDPLHQLTVLREDGSNKLQTISTLPNTQEPALIGKPGEDIYSVRFTGDRAYVVTFERIDPLYVIDLSQPEIPSIVGELEVPGFSSYLHPLSNDWLLGIGHEVSNGLRKGVKVELYDIRDINNPVVKNTLIYGNQGSHSEALYDLRSISLLKVNDEISRLALPMEIWGETNAAGYRDWVESGLYLFELTSNGSNEMDLDYSGKMVAESHSTEQSYSRNSGVDRSKLTGNAVYYLHGNQIHSSLWGEWAEINGPF